MIEISGVVVLNLKLSLSRFYINSQDLLFCLISHHSIFYLCYFTVLLPKIHYNPKSSLLTLSSMDDKAVSKRDVPSCNSTAVSRRYKMSRRLGHHCIGCLYEFTNP